LTEEKRLKEENGYVPPFVDLSKIRSINPGFHANQLYTLLPGQRYSAENEAAHDARGRKDTLKYCGASWLERFYYAVYKKVKEMKYQTQDLISDLPGKGVHYL
jgi:hypothetical protein